MAIVEYINLTRGKLCTVPFNVHVSRIQSTHCEAKYWPGVIYGAGADMLYHLARGFEVVVHDQSEKDHDTRAVWQGLSFVKRACETFWGLELTPITSRGEKSMEQYFDRAITKLPRGTKKYIRYYAQFSLGICSLQVQGCTCRSYKYNRATALVE